MYQTSVDGLILDTYKELFPTFIQNKKKRDLILSFLLLFFMSIETKIAFFFYKNGILERE